VSESVLVLQVLAPGDVTTKFSRLLSSGMEGYDDEEFLSEVDLKEKEFHGMVREVVILCLISIILYIGSFAFLGLLRRDKDEEFLPYTDNSDLWVYKISLWCCSFSLAVSVGAALLLPISTISNEVLHRYPKSWYMKWLNSSLIHGIWNLIFTLTNVALFLLLPFAYLFCESEGFTGARRGLINRAKETLVTLLLLSVVVLGIMYILAAFIDRDQATMDQLFNVYSYYLPFLYSCVSFLGVLFLLVCTPLGFVRLFTLVGDLVTRPQFMKDLNEDYHVALMEEAAFKKKVGAEKLGGRLVNMAPVIFGPQDECMLQYLERKHDEAVDRRVVIEKARSRGVLARKLGWPIAMLTLITLTGISLYLVAANMMLLAAGWRSLPSNKVAIDLGTTSLSTLGVIGVVIEVLIIGYLLVTSIVGLYSIPSMKKLLPRKGDTSMTYLILNCALFVILSSALPLLVKVLGITHFDLLGNYGRIRWLGNYFIIFAVNILFCGAAAFCLFNKVTHRAQVEIWRRLSNFLGGFKQTVIQKLGLWGKSFGLTFTQKIPNVVSSPVRIKSE